MLKTDIVKELRRRRRRRSKDRSERNTDKLADIRDKERQRHTIY